MTDYRPVGLDVDVPSSSSESASSSPPSSSSTSAASLVPSVASTSSTVSEGAIEDLPSLPSRLFFFANLSPENPSEVPAQVAFRVTIAEAHSSVWAILRIVHVSQWWASVVQGRLAASHGTFGTPKS